MKTILVTTDFSDNANNAVNYAFKMATVMRANVKLVHAIKVPSESVFAAQVAWPVEDYESLTFETNNRLALLAKSLGTDLKLDCPNVHEPLINYTCQVGSVVDVTRNLVEEEGASMLVMGLSGAGALSRFMLGSISKDMIEKASLPVLLIPPGVPYRPIKKIAFATDFDSADIELINQLGQFAKPCNAEILIVHVFKERYERKEHVHATKKFLAEVSSKTNYDKIYYRNIHDLNVNNGLEWLNEHGNIDMVAMAHRQRSILETMFDSSHTQSLARHINIPLFVFQKR